MEDQKDKQSRFIFYSHLWSYLPGMPIITTTIHYIWFRFVLFCCILNGNFPSCFLIKVQKRSWWKPEGSDAEQQDFP